MPREGERQGIGQAAMTRRRSLNDTDGERLLHGGLYDCIPASITPDGSRPCLENGEDRKHESPRGQKRILVQGAAGLPFGA